MFRTKCRVGTVSAFVNSLSKILNKYSSLLLCPVLYVHYGQKLNQFMSENLYNFCWAAMIPGWNIPSPINPRAEERRARMWWHLENTPLTSGPTVAPRASSSTLWDLKEVMWKPLNFIIFMVPSRALILWISNSHPRCKLLRLITIDIWVA